MFGVHITFGANYNLTDYVYVGLEGKYRWTDEVDLHDSFAGYDVAYEGNLNGYSVAATLGMRF